MADPFHVRVRTARYELEFRVARRPSTRVILPIKERAEKVEIRADAGRTLGDSEEGTPCTVSCGKFSVEALWVAEDGNSAYVLDERTARRHGETIVQARGNTTKEPAYQDMLVRQQKEKETLANEVTSQSATTEPRIKPIPKSPRTSERKDQKIVAKSTKTKEKAPTTRRQLRASNECPVCGQPSTTGWICQKDYNARNLRLFDGANAANRQHVVALNKFQRSTGDYSDGSAIALINGQLTSGQSAEAEEAEEVEETEETEETEEVEELVPSL